MTDYRRQSNLLDQQKLLDSKVTLIGSGPIANYTLCLLAGLGVGKIKILTQDRVTGFEKDEFLIGQDWYGRQKAACLEDRLSKINSSIQVKGRSIGPDVAFLGRPHIVVDTTNDPNSKRSVANIIESFPDRFEDCSKIIFASGDYSSCEVGTYDLNQQSKGRIHRRRVGHQRYQDSFSRERQGALTSCIAASIIVDEIRKTLHPLKRDHSLESFVRFDLDTLKYTIGGNHCDQEKPQVPSSKRALIVGAGGIGTYVALNLALCGIGELHIYDPDIIESHNLNRQLLYHSDECGERKASTLAKRLSETRPDIDVHAYDIAFGEEQARNLRAGEYDIMFSCLDSFSARKLLSDAAVRSQIPLVNGSVSTFDAFSDVYLPRITPCLDCRHDYTSLMALDNRPMSCANQSANIVMPNAMAGAMMAASGLHILNGNMDRPFTTKRFVHTSQARDNHKFNWVPFTAEKDTAACECTGGSR